MSKKIFVWLLATFLLATISFVAAQQPAKIPRVGIIRGNPDDGAPSMKILRQALQDLGYIEGKILSSSFATTTGIGTASRQSWPSS